MKKQGFKLFLLFDYPGNGRNSSIPFKTGNLTGRRVDFDGIIILQFGYIIVKNPHGVFKIHEDRVRLTQSLNYIIRAGIGAQVIENIIFIHQPALIWVCTVGRRRNILPGSRFFICYFRPCFGVRFRSGSTPQDQQK